MSAACFSSISLMESRATPTQLDSINVLNAGKPNSTVYRILPNMALPMKKRYVKRLIRKIVFFVLTIAFISLITTMIVEKRMNPNTEPDERDLDPNGDKSTEPFKGGFNEPPTRRPARPPFQDRRLAREPERKLPPAVAPAVPAQPPVQTYNISAFKLPIAQGPHRDWHDYAAMEADKKRTGLGEHGLPAYVEPHEKELEKEIYKENGFNGMLSDRISLNRSVMDVRHEKCKSRQYLAELPSISVVFIFFNEHFNTLLRSIYSVINRTPPELLKQIVLVDDGSDREYLKAQLDDYVAANWPQLVQVVHNPERLGLIGARLAGAKVATADVMVFFDSHIEVNYNWLPPLLEPIAVNYKISTCPIIDVIHHETFEYRGGYQEGTRGGFDWQFYYKQLPVLPEDSIDKSQPYRNPVMMGGLFAIDRKFFWELGGYDDELDIWGGEQYELSFKIWMCGGMLLDVPCSRVAHIFRGEMTQRPSPRNYNFVARNHKRVAEVWMDEYKEHVYRRDPQTYNNIDAGDLSRQREVRERMHCKSFHWYMTEIAPDFLVKFPPVEPPTYAQGAIKNLGFPQYCIDTMGKGSENPIGLYPCAENLTQPQPSQFWALSHDRELRLVNSGQCLDVQTSTPNSTVWMWNCHNQGGNQFWWYDREHQWIVHGNRGHRCMEAFVEGDQQAVYTNICDASNDRMRWLFGSIDNEMLDKFFEGLSH